MQMEKPLFFTIDAIEALKQFGTNEMGLTEHEAKWRHVLNGPNKLQKPLKISLARRFLNQLLNIMVLILALAALVALFVGDYKSTIIILAVIIMNSILSVLQEYKAEKAIDSLQDLAWPEAEVRRKGHLHKIRAAELVVGDVIILEAGDHIPADMRLIKAVNPKVKESALTGESVPVEKHIDVVGDTNAMIGDRKNMTYMGPNVVYGRGSKTKPVGSHVSRTE